MSEVYRLKYLKGRRLKVFLAVADRIIPPDGDNPGGGTMQAAGIVDWTLGRLDPGMRMLLFALMLGVEALGFFFGAKPFTMLSDEKKDKLLGWMEVCPIRLLRLGFFGLKTYACLGYYPREDVWKQINYSGPVLPDRAFPDKVIRLLCQGQLEVTS